MIYDVAIIGAGPAGSATARRLAAAGARVVLVGGESRAGIEGLSTRSHQLLMEEGIEPDSPVFAGPYPRDGRWTPDRQVAGTEWVTERSALARALRDNAIAAGARSYSQSLRGLSMDAKSWRMHLLDGTTCLTSLIVDARGRRGPEVRGPVLLAVGRRYYSRTANSPGTHLAAIEDGWCWWAARGNDVWVQVVGRPGPRHPAKWIEAASLKVADLGRVLAGAIPVGKVVARPAHARLGLPARGEATWRVGDAAMALDPLSGQGIYEALRSARLVSAAVLSVSDGGEPGIARRFVTERTYEAWLRGVTLAAGFYRELAGWGEFWVHTARQYEALIPVTPGGGAVVERRPVLLEGRIVEREVLIVPGHPRGVWHVKGVPLVALKRYLDGASRATVSGAAVALDVPPAAAASAIHWLQASGLLRGQVSANGALGG